MKARKIAIVAATVLGLGVWHLSIGQVEPAEAPSGQTPPVEASPTQAPAARNVIYLSREAPYSDISRVDRAVVSECRLPQQGAEAIENAAREAGITIVRDQAAAKGKQGRVLQVEITDIGNFGNAFIGHRKQVVLKGRMFDDGKEIGDFYGKRSSMGGMFSGFKGSCTVLERCLEALARDLTPWLKNPAANTRIGE